jgi:CRP-like cAMP-binding protein
VAQPVSFLEGAQLVRHGEAARGAWVLREGLVEAVVMVPGGGRTTVATFGAGSVFGEMSLIERGTCAATVIALSNVDGWFVEADAFRSLAALRGAAALGLQRALTHLLAEKLRAVNAKVRAQPAPEDRPASVPLPASDPLRGVPRTRAASFDIRAFLHLLPLFQSFDAMEIDEAVAEARVLELPRGAWIFVEEQVAESCYAVVRGAVEVTDRGGGVDRRIAVLGPGSLVGQMALLDGSAHGASARAREDCVLLEWDRAAFNRLYHGASGTTVKLIHAIQRSLLGSIAHTNTRLTRLISHSQLAAGAAARTELESALHGQLWRAAG